MNKFGSSHIVFGSDGTPLKIQEETAEICQTCIDSADAPEGGMAFGILRETGGTATLICPNCGQVKHVKSYDVVRKSKGA